MRVDASFPIDAVTLAGLRSACEFDDEDGRTHLFEFLDFGVDTTEIAEHCDDGMPVYRGGWSPHHVIVALIDEIERLR